MKTTKIYLFSPFNNRSLSLNSNKTDFQCGNSTRWDKDPPSGYSPAIGRVCVFSRIH